jgi:mRNA interferase MazF
LIGAAHSSPDLLITPLTSRVAKLYAGDFLLSDWRGAGLHVPTVAKRGVYTIHSALVLQVLGRLVNVDVQQLDRSLRQWLDLP